MHCKTLWSAEWQQTHLWNVNRVLRSTRWASGKTGSLNLRKMDNKFRIGEYMKPRFKKQAYQTAAVEAVLNCFTGQPLNTGLTYRIDPGRPEDTPQLTITAIEELTGFRNSNIALPLPKVLENIQAVQRHHNLPQSQSLVSNQIADVNLDIEMETGTGKTYCYIKTMFEMNKRYGWTKFIVVVPSIAIREGVYKSFEITAEHFLEDYGKRTRFFIYDSKQLHNLESYSSDGGINVMIINVQAFNATGKDARRIYEELDDFQSRRPIDVIKQNRPILILDEPQKMEGRKTLDSLKEFNPLMVLRYSATHKTQHNKVYRLDALDAYNQKLVKKIAVRGFRDGQIPICRCVTELPLTPFVKTAADFHLAAAGAGAPRR